MYIVIFMKGGNIGRCDLFKGCKLCVSFHTPSLRGSLGASSVWVIRLFLLCPRHKMARGHLVFALFVILSFRPSVIPSFCHSVPSKFVFSTPPTSLHGFE